MSEDYLKSCCNLLFYYEVNKENQIYEDDILHGDIIESFIYEGESLASNIKD